MKKKINVVLMLMLLVLPNLVFASAINTDGAFNVMEAIKLALFAVAGITITILIAYVGVLEISCQSDKIQILRVENARRKTNRF